MSNNDQRTVQIGGLRRVQYKEHMREYEPGNPVPIRTYSAATQNRSDRQRVRLIQISQNTEGLSNIYQMADNEDDNLNEGAGRNFNVLVDIRTGNEIDLSVPPIRSDELDYSKIIEAGFVKHLQNNEAFYTETKLEEFTTTQLGVNTQGFRVPCLVHIWYTDEHAEGGVAMVLALSNGITTPAYFAVRRSQEDNDVETE